MAGQCDRGPVRGEIGRRLGEVGQCRFVDVRTTLAMAVTAFLRYGVHARPRSIVVGTRPSVATYEEY